MNWEIGVATVLSLKDGVVVRCPFCRQTHRHLREFAGSREVLAGCHVGPVRCRSYAIPSTPRGKR